MDLHLYMHIIRKRLPLAAVIFVLTTIATAIFVIGQPIVFESTSSVVVRPRAESPEDIARAQAILSTGPEINSTYATIVESEKIRDRAKQSLGWSSASGIKVTGSVVVGTNILEVTSAGEDPERITAFADAVVAETIKFVGIREAFELVLLESASEADNPIGPSKLLTLLLGCFVGLGLGVGGAIGAEYVAESVFNRTWFNILDPATGTYNEAFLMLRFRQEMERARRNRILFSLGVVKVRKRDHKTGAPDRFPTIDELRTIAGAVRPALKEEDVLAYMGDGSFAVMFMDTPAQEADRVLAEWREAVAATTTHGSEGPWSPFQMSVGVCQMDGTSALDSRSSVSVLPAERAVNAGPVVRPAIGMREAGQDLNVSLRSDGFVVEDRE